MAGWPPLQDAPPALKRAVPPPPPLALTPPPSEGLNSEVLLQVLPPSATAQRTPSPSLPKRAEVSWASEDEEISNEDDDDEESQKWTSVVPNQQSVTGFQSLKSLMSLTSLDTFETELSSPRLGLSAKVLRPCGRYAKIVMPTFALLVGVSTIAMIAWDVVAFGGRGVWRQCEVAHTPDAEPKGRWSITLCISTTVLLTPGAIWLLMKAPTTHMRCVAGYASLIWAAMWLRTMEQLALCKGGESSEDVLDEATPYRLGADACYSWSTLVFCMLLFHRVKTLSNYSMQDGGVCRLKIIFFGLMAVWATGIFIWGVLRVDAVMQVHEGLDPMSMWDGVLQKVMGVFTNLGLFFYAIFCVLSLRVLTIARRFAINAAEHATEMRQAMEATSAASALGMQWIGAFVGCTTSCVVFFLYVSRNGLLWPLPSIDTESNFYDQVQALYIIWPSVLDALANGFSALALSGALTGAVDGKATAQRLLRQQKGRREEFAGAAARLERELAEEDPELARAWQANVEALANRGITLGALLRFYRHLGSKYMKHYDSTKHTTADVVREAIIPLSASKGQALATIMMRGRRSRPKKMVTHSWSGCFRDLVAAIVADAVGEGEYGHIAHLLDHNFVKLERWVRSLGVHREKYWVCAFAVNQHLAICGREHVDSVNGARAVPCSCCLPKAGNNTPPFLPDGRSVPCEMNKFNDMMSFLTKADPEFSQVIAVDAKLDLFRRAWCVSEVYTAHRAGMMQALKFRSTLDLHLHRPLLSSLRIQDMEASREEDRLFILARIKDHESFNVELRNFVNQDLVPAWETLDACEKMARVGSLLRRKWPGLEHLGHRELEA